MNIRSALSLAILLPASALALSPLPYNCSAAGCLNGGICKINSSGGSSTSNVFNSSAPAASCECPPNYEGEDCSVQVEICDESQRCWNGGVCYLDSDADAFRCDCPKTDVGIHLFGGDNCQVQLYEECSGDQDEDFQFCVNGGVCLTTASCNCSSAYVPYLEVLSWGDHCEVLQSSNNTDQSSSNSEARWIGLLLLAFAVIATIIFVLWRALKAKQEYLQRQLEQCREAQMEATQQDPQESDLDNNSGPNTIIDSQTQCDSMDPSQAPSNKKVVSFNG